MGGRDRGWLAERYEPLLELLGRVLHDETLADDLAPSYLARAGEQFANLTLAVGAIHR